MKKSLFLVPVLALALTGCSNDEPVANVDNNGNTETNYLTVNLVSAMGSRAAADQYEEGTTAENTVKEVRFYFFDDQNEPAAVKYVSSGSTYVSYFDWTPEKPGAADMPNISKRLEATIVINTREGDKVPVSVIAVVNPTQELKAKGNMSVANLEDYIADFSDVATNGFVMSNAIYAKGEVKMNEVEIAGHLGSTPDLALANPVVIYVERVVAKVSLSMDAALESKEGTYEGQTFPIYKVSTGEKTETYEGQELYVRILGWNVTAKTDASYLMKHINPKWSANLFGNTEDWNHPEYFRSYWAQNPSNGIHYSDFNVEDLQAANQISVGGYTYLQENAAKDATGADADTHTKVIIAGQIVNENGTPVEFAEWAGVRYTTTDLTKLLAQVSNIYKVTVTDAGKTFTRLAPEDIEIVSATAAGVTATEAKAVDPSKKGRYYAYAQLKSTDETAQYAIGNSEDAELLDYKAINGKLIDLGGCKVWENGHTYYFFDIAHLGSNGYGEYGVVRNHVYKTNITSIAGLGTPVYDPDEVIYPERPENDYTYVAAQINILSWRIVNNDVDVD